MTEKINTFKISKAITIVVIFIAFFVVNGCNYKPVIKNEKVKLSNNELKTNTKQLKITETIEANFKTLDHKGLKMNHYTKKKISGTLLLNNGEIFIYGFNTALFNPNTNKFKKLNNERCFNPVLMTEKSIFCNRNYYSKFDISTNKFIKTSKQEFEKYKIKDEGLNKSRKYDESERTEIKYFPYKSKMLYAANCTGNKDNKDCGVIWLEDNKLFKRYKYGKLHHKRSKFDAIILENGKILIMGGGYTNNKGKFEAIKDIEQYDPETGEVLIVGKTKYPHIDSKAILLNDGSIFISYNNEDYQYSTEIFNPEDGDIYSPRIQEFNNKDNFNNEYELALLNDGKVLLFGSMFELYNPKTRILSKLPNIEKERCQSKLTVLKNNKVLIFGGSEISYLGFKRTFCSLSNGLSPSLLTIKNRQSINIKE